MRDIYQNGKGLIQPSATKKVIVNFDEIENGKKYQVHNYSQDFPGWQKKEADAMEKETKLRMMTFLEELKTFKAEELPISLSTEFSDEKGVKIQEWDGIVSTKDTLYLLEAKHTMTVKKVKKIAERVKKFPKIVARSTRKDEIDLKNKKIVGVACGTLFPNDCCDEAHLLGLLDMYPSGSRYKLGGETIL